MHSKRNSKRPKRWWLVRSVKNLGRYVMAECATVEKAREAKRLYGTAFKTRIVEVK
jgi:putative N-acetylmannosamine-6-phosphate epimerase